MGIVTGYLSQLVSSGIKLLVGGSAVSSSNPLPVQRITVTGSTGGTETRPRNIAMMYIIKT